MIVGLRRRPSLEALVSRLAAVRVHVFAVHQVQKPAQFVVLSVVRRISRVQGEVHRLAGYFAAVDPVGLRDHCRRRLQAQRLLRPEGVCSHRGPAGLHPLAPQRRLFIDDPEVREVMERQKGTPAVIAASLRVLQISADDIGLARRIDERAVFIEPDCAFDRR